MIASLLNISEPYFFYSSIENTTREMYKPEIVIRIGSRFKFNDDNGTRQYEQLHIYLFIRNNPYYKQKFKIQ